MNSLAVVVMALVALANAGRIPEPLAELSDKDMFLTIIRCSKEAIITGIPEIGIPSHNPLVIPHIISVNEAIGDYNVSFSVEDMIMENIPWWEVRQFDELDEDDTDTDVFQYVIYWRNISFSANVSLNIIHEEDDRIVFDDYISIDYFRLDEVNFSGTYNFTKPHDEVNGTFNDVELSISIDDAKLKLGHFGFLGDIIDNTVEPIISGWLKENLPTFNIGPAIKDRFNTFWLENPEKIQGIIDHCSSI